MEIKMDKIRSLMEQMGFSSEATNQLLQLIKDHIETEKKSINEGTAKKLVQVKEACVKTMKEELARLSKSVGIYLESKSEKIERAKLQQLAIEESKSADQLKRVKALVENVDLTKSDDKNGTLQATERKISLLKHQQERLVKENKDLATKLKASNEIATRFMRKAINENTSNNAAPAKPDDTAKSGKVVAESKASEVKDNKTDDKAPKATLKEEKQKVAPAEKTLSTAGISSFTPDDIANLME
jgi:hypothetical protein